MTVWAPAKVQQSARWGTGREAGHGEVEPMRMSRRAKPDDGAVAVEFALVLPILLVLVFGIVDFTRAMNASVSATHAAREGVRVLALGDGDSVGGAETRASEAFDASLASGSLSFNSVQSCPDQPDADDDAVLAVSASVNWITPLGNLADGVGNGITVRGVAEMRCGG